MAIILSDQMLNGNDFLLADAEWQCPYASQC
jgi:hypothetical protein